MRVELALLAMGGTIDKDYPRSTKGYAFEIDEPAADRVLRELPFFALPFNVQSICKKDSTEIDAADREQLVRAVRDTAARRVVVTHGTDTLIESAQHIARSGAAEGKVVAFTGAMKPERFKDSDAVFNLGLAVGATAIGTPGAVFVCMGGRVIESSRCVRRQSSGLFEEAADG